MSNQLEIYQNEDGSLQLAVALQHESLWLSQQQFAQLFNTSTDNISLHLKNIYQSGELDENSTTEDYSVVRQEGGHYLVSRRIKPTRKRHHCPLNRKLIKCELNNPIL